MVHMWFVTWEFNTSHFYVHDSVLVAELHTKLELPKICLQFQTKLSSDIIPVNKEGNRHNPEPLAPDDLAPCLISPCSSNWDLNLYTFL